MSIFPGRPHCDAVEHIVAPFGGAWTHLAVSGDDARGLLRAGLDLLADIERKPSTADRDPFSKAVLKAIPKASMDDRFLVISPTVCPLDLARDHIGNWGDRAMFSHLHTTVRPSTRLVEKALSVHRAPLRTYLLLCPMAMDRALARNLGCSPI